MFDCLPLSGDVTYGLDMYNREIKQLKDKYEKSSSSTKSFIRTKSNPYVTSPDSGKQSQQSLRSKLSGSNISLLSIQQGDIPSLSMTIPTYRLQGYGSDTHYEFEVQIAIGEEKWGIFRRYSRFRELHQDWKKKYLKIGGLVFPSRKLFNTSENVTLCLTVLNLIPVKKKQMASLVVFELCYF